MPIEDLKTMIIDNEHNKFTTMYYLLAKKHQRGEIDLRPFEDSEIKGKILEKWKLKISQKKEKVKSMIKPKDPLPPKSFRIFHQSITNKSERGTPRDGSIVSLSRTHRPLINRRMAYQTMKQSLILSTR